MKRLNFIFRVLIVLVVLKFLTGLTLFFVDAQGLSAKNENRTYHCPPEISEFLLLEKEKLMKKQRELEARERELKLLEKRVEEQINTLKQLSLEVEEKLNKISAIQDERLKLLAKAYSEMKPAKAAQQLVNMDKDMAVKILSQLKSSQVASILSAMPPEKAAVLAEALSGYPPREY